MKLSVRSRIFRRMMKLFVTPADAPIAKRRAALERAGKLPGPRGVDRKSVEVGGVPALRGTLVGGPAKRHVLYFHGGGYIMGSSSSHFTIAARLGKMADASVTVVDYRLAPEHPFPAALDDCVAAARDLIGELGASRVAIAGDSAGGGVTIATLCALRDAGGPLPACAFVMSPWVDLTGSGDSVTSKRNIDPVIEPDMLGGCAADYLNGVDASDPGASPLFADLTGLPPLLIQVGSDEVLLDDSVRLAESAKQAGVDVELDEWPGMWHVFQALVGPMPEATKAMQQGAAFITRHTPHD